MNPSSGTEPPSTVERGQDPPALLGRDAELAAMGLGIEAGRRGDGALLAVEGSAGVGKTALLGWALGAARARGMRALLATATPLEAAFPFGVARQLFDPVRRELGEGAWAELSSGAARYSARALDERALEVADPSEDPAFATLHGLYWLSANLALDRPLLLAIDDAQWADRPSLRLLAHLARRLDGLPVVVVIAVRSGDPSTDELLVSELLAAAEPTVRPGPLHEPEAAEVMRSRLGEGIGVPLCAAAHRATGGNPFLLGALVDALVSGEVERSPQAVDSLRGVRLESVARTLLRRVAHLPRGSYSLVTAAAALGGESPLVGLAELAGLDVATGVRAAEALRGAGILAPGPAVSFAHPVVRAAVYEGMPSDERRALHLRAAERLLGAGAPAEQAAVHYLAVECSGEPRVASILRQAAHQASARGASDVAASYLRRALAEPPPEAERPNISFELGLAELAADEPDSSARAVQAVRGIPDPQQRAEAALEAAILLGYHGDSPDVVSVCAAGLESGAAIDRELAAKLESEMALWSFLDAATVAAGVDWVRAARQREDPLTAPAAAIGTAWICLAHEARAAAAELDQISEMVATGSLFSRRSPVLAQAATWILAVGGRAGLARDVGDAVVRAGQDQGSMLLTRVGRFWRGFAAYELGLVADAVADSAAVFEGAVEGAGGAEGVAYSLGSLIKSLVEAGDPDGAEAALARAALADEPPRRIVFALLLESRGKLRSAQGRLGDAAEDLFEAGRRWEELRVRSPVPTGWRGDAALALARIGRGEEAVTLAREQLELARQAQEPRTLGRSLRALGEVQGGPSGRALLAQAVDVLQRTPARLELAEALLSQGRALRKEGARVAARGVLAEALDIAHRGGAERVGRIAREELRLAGARPRRAALSGPGSLTSAERRVAELAAQGTPNREIAQRLFVSLRTVETHLTHVYTKLEIASRDELAAALAL